MQQDQFGHIYNEGEHDKDNCEECRNHMTDSFTSPQPEEWSVRFDEEFTHNGDGKFWQTDALGYETDPVEVKDFIKTEIRKAEERGRKETVLYKHVKIAVENEVYNQAITDVVGIVGEYPGVVAMSDGNTYRSVIDRKELLANLEALKK